MPLQKIIDNRSRGSEVITSTLPRSPYFTLTLTAHRTPHRIYRCRVGSWRFQTLE